MVKARRSASRGPAGSRATDPRADVFIVDSEDGDPGADVALVSERLVRARYRAEVTLVRESAGPED
jgi:hypothetical protein